MKKFLIVILTLISLLCVSCKKESSTGVEEQEEVTLLGTWQSYNVRYVDPFEPSESYTEARGDCKVTFTETEAEFVLEEMPTDTETGYLLSSFKSGYTFKDGDDSIIYFEDAYNKYGQEIVAQFSDGQLVVAQYSSEWDWHWEYFFTKIQ